METNSGPDPSISKQHGIEPTTILNPQFIPTSPSYFTQNKHSHTRPSSPSGTKALKSPSAVDGTTNNPLEPATWDMRVTSAWLIEYDLEGFVDLFIKNDIHGENFATLNHKRLRSLGVPSYKERSKLLRTLRNCFPQLDTLTIQTDVGKACSTSRLYPVDYQPFLISPLNLPEFSLGALSSQPNLNFNSYAFAGTKSHEKNLPVSPPVFSDLVLDDFSFQEVERFADSLMVDAPFPVEVEGLELEERFSNPLMASSCDIPEHVLMGSSSEPLEFSSLAIPEDFMFEESFSDPLEISPLVISEDVMIEESFSDPLEISSLVIPEEVLIEESFSDPLELSSFVIPEDVMIDDSFSDPLQVSSLVIPEEVPSEETFSELLEAYGPYIPNEPMLQESFSDPLLVYAPEAHQEFELDASFSDQLELEPPPMAFISPKDTFEQESHDQISPLYPNFNPNAHSEKKISIYGNSNASVSAPSLSGWGLEKSVALNLPSQTIDSALISIEATESHDSYFDLAPTPQQGLQPVIKPRKESMINLGKPRNGPAVPRSPTHRDAILPSQRRSSLFYDLDPRLMDGQPKRTDQYMNTFPRTTHKPDAPSSHRLSSKLKPATAENSFFGNLLPDFFKPFSKHNRKLSCPDDLKFDKNKVIQVSLEDGGTYSVNIGGCISAEEVSATIFSSLLLDNQSHQYHVEELLVDGSTRVVSPRQLLVLCSKTDHKGRVRLMLRKSPQTKEPEPGSPRILGSAPQISPVPVPTTAEEAVVPSWAQLWGERPSTEMISSQLEKFFPNHDLDSPILEETPSGFLDRRKSIRMVVEEEVHRRKSSRLSRRSTKLWGSRIMQLKDEKVADPPAQEPSDIPDELKNLHSATQIKWVKGRAIGKGSFGRVFHALNAESGEMLAVKVIDLPSPKKTSPSSGANLGRKRGDLVRELYREIELLKDLDHENIVQYLGFEANDISINIFLEYVSGGSIASVLSRSGPFEELYAANLIRQTLRGLAYLHGCNILHRDIKAANVLINQEGVCKISDFGISKRNDYTRAYRFNSRMSFKGSVFWMAPEVVIDHGYSAKVDIWSLGCLLIEMITGQRPWKELNELAAVYRLGKSTPESAPPIPSESSDESKSFLGQCFIIEPESRPTAEQLLEHEFCTKGFKPSQRGEAKEPSVPVDNFETESNDGSFHSLTSDHSDIEVDNAG